MSRRLSDLEPVTREKVLRLISVAAGLGMELFIVHTLRSYEEQDALYAQGRTAPGPIVTNAKGGYSWHNFARAIDFAFEDERGKPVWDDVSDDEINDWRLLGECGRKIGFTWGGDWTIRDLGHFHYPGRYTLEYLRQEEKDDV